MSVTRPFDRGKGFGDCSMKDGGLRAGGQCFGVTAGEAATAAGVWGGNTTHPS